MDNKSSNFRDFRNLVENIEDMVIKEDLEGYDTIFFTNNTVAESITAKTLSTSDILYDLIVRVFKLKM